MSRVHYSFDSAVAAVAAAPETRESPIVRAVRRAKRPSRPYLRRAMENLGLFAFGFGATNLLIHFAVGFFYALRMSSMVPHLNL
ncbi:hypothetical protein [Methylocystis parvus]|jgi:hypothetical protein|uniref:hypothetical protein n=1 Tax=Methylocystis parvus TaxID=134 RepID=UPI003C74743B